MALLLSRPSRPSFPRLRGLEQGDRRHPQEPGNPDPVHRGRHPGSVQPVSENKAAIHPGFGGADRLLRLSRLFFELQLQYIL